MVVLDLGEDKGGTFQSTPAATQAICEFVKLQSVPKQCQVSMRIHNEQLPAGIATTDVKLLDMSGRRLLALESRVTRSKKGSVSSIVSWMIRWIESNIINIVGESRCDVCRNEHRPTKALLASADGFTWSVIDPAFLVAC